MIKKVVINNGKKYIVNSVGWDYDVGPGAPAGTLWMQSQTDSNWYAVSLTGTSGSAALYVNQTPLGWQSPSNEPGYQLIINQTNQQVYQVYLTGNAGSVTVVVSATPWPLQGDYKPFFFLKSTDGNFYKVNDIGGTLTVDQNSKWNPVSASYSYYN